MCGCRYNGRREKKRFGPVRVETVLKGEVQAGAKVVVAFQPTAFIKTNKDKELIFFLTKPFASENGSEFRKVVRGRRDIDGMAVKTDHLLGEIMTILDHVKVASDLTSRRAVKSP